MNTVNVDLDVVDRYRELHAAHLRDLQQRYQARQLDQHRQDLARQHDARIRRARELELDLGQNIDRMA
jgi:hypothetical protein